MALATATITYDLADQVGLDYDPRRTRVYASTNVEGDTLVDTTADKIRLGCGYGTVNEDGTGSITVWIPGAGSNPASWQTFIHVDYPDRHGRASRTFGPFTITASANLADLIPEQDIPPNYTQGVLAQMTALRDSQVDISGISTSDGVVEALVKNTGGAGPLTTAALSAKYAARTDLVRVEAKNLPAWTKKRQLALLGQSPARVLCVGDSTTAGVYSDSYTSATGSTNQGGPNSYPARLAARLTSLGVPALHALVIPGHTGNDDSRWPVGGWSYAGGNIGAGANAGMTASSAGTTVITPGVVADRYIVYFFGDAGTGTFTAQATGGSSVSVNTVKATAGIDTSANVLASSASASNTLTLTWSSGTVFVVAVECYNSALPGQVRIMGAGVGSSRAENWAGATNANLYGGRALIKRLAPDLTVISLGVNDAAGSRTTATVLGHVQTLAADADISGDVLLASALMHSTPGLVDDYNAAYLATTWPYVDFQHRYGNTMQAMGLMTTDDTHPNAIGYGDMAFIIAQALLV